MRVGWTRFKFAVRVVYFYMQGEGKRAAFKTKKAENILETFRVLLYTIVMSGAGYKITP